MENENKNHDTQDNKPKFSFRPAETPIEDFPLAEEEEDETPTSDGYGYSDFEADDGDDDYPEEKLSFRERLAKRRAETEASNAAEQAAFDEDDEYEEHDEKDRAPRPSFRERFAKSRAAQKAAEEETDEDKEDETFSLSLRERLAKRRAEREAAEAAEDDEYDEDEEDETSSLSLRERLAKRRAEREAAEAAEDDEYDDEDDEELRPTRRRIAVRQSETAARPLQRAEKHAERPAADKPVQRAEKHVERPVADKPAQRGEKHVERPVADKPAQRAEKPVERPSEDRPTAKKTDSPVKNRRNHAPTAVEKTAQNRKPANQESGSGDKNKSKTFPAFSGSELNAGGADENVKKRFVPIIGAFAAFIAVCVIFTLCASVLTRKTVTGSRVYISEIMTSNSSSVPAPDGEFYDWIELCNPTDEAVDVSGFGFGLDSAAAVWTIPSGTR